MEQRVAVAILLLIACSGLTSAQEAIVQEVVEAAIVVVEPSQPFHTQGGRLSFTCVAYGEPTLPNITWSAPSLGVTDFEDASLDNSVTVMTSQLIDEETGLTFVISILELCNVNYTYSFVDDISCSVDNGVYNSTITKNTSNPFSTTPIVYEPAFLLAAPPMGQYRSGGPRISATCVAYGSPRPSIRWTQNLQDIAQDNFTNIYTQNYVDEDGDILAVSTLEICTDMYIPGETSTSCTATNGIQADMEDQERVQSVSFVIDTRTAIDSFTVRLLGDTAVFIMTFSDIPDISMNCFMNKLWLANGDNTSDPLFTIFRPLHPGLCVATDNPYVVDVYLDRRDYRSSLDYVGSLATLYILSIPDQEVNFLPGTSLLPIRNPLWASGLTLNSEPRMESFDVDFNTNRVILHFTDYMDISTLQSNQLTLVNPESGLMLTLESTSVPVNPTDQIVRTACITISSAEVDTLQTICTSHSNCSCYFSSALVSSHSGESIIAVEAGSPLPVSKLRFSRVSSPSLYMQLSLSYEGCSAMYTLRPDEVYILRSSENVTRIECVSSGVLDNINPIISFDMYEGLLSSEDTPPLDVTLDWPAHRAYYALPDGLPPQYFGLYTCQTDNSMIQHYIYDMPRHLALPDGYTYAVRLYDSFTVPFFLGSDPLIYLLEDNVQVALYNAELDTLIAPQPEHRLTSVYRGELNFNTALFSQEGQYSLRLLIDEQVIVNTLFNITVDFPMVRVIPPVAAVLPRVTRITLQCLTNSPAIPVEWVSTLDDTDTISNENTLTLSVPQQGGFVDGERFYCRIRDPESAETIVGSAVTVVQNVREELAVLYNGVQLENFDQIAVPDSLFGLLDLFCVGHTPNDVVELTWIAEELGQFPVIFQESSEGNYTTVSHEYNVANITVNNSIRPYRGTLTCRADSTDVQIAIYIVEVNTEVRFCSTGDSDPVYGIEWAETLANFSDNQPCPDLNGLETVGRAFRLCLEEGTWDSYVNVSNCQSSEFTALLERANEIFAISDGFTTELLGITLSMLTDTLTTLTAPGNLSSLPLDLNVSNYLLENIVTRLPTDPLMTDIFNVFDNVLDLVNEEGWTELNKIAYGSPQLLESIEAFSMYIVTSQTTEPTRLDGKNIVIGAYGVDLASDVVFPGEDLSLEGEFTVPMALLREKEATGVAGALIRGLPIFIPQPKPRNETGKLRAVGSAMLSVQLVSPIKGDFQVGGIELIYNTTLISRAGDPQCEFWNETTGQWDDSKVVTEEVVDLETQQFKSYNVRCISGHATAFAVIVELETEVFNFSIPVYIGCLAVIVAAAVSLFVLLLSFCTDKLRRYALVLYFSHMSVCVSLICAFLGFVAGIELAIENEIGCITTAAILHYFFTAAFSWVFCESLLLVFFPYFSKHRSCFLFLFLVGWTLPAIPTGISLGLMRDDYVTTQNCWFFFDGAVEHSIVLSFIVPKLLFFAATLVLLMISCFTMWIMSRKHFKGPSKTILHMFRFLWAGVLLLLGLLALTWIFVVLLVNVYGIDSTAAGWLFMAFAIALAVWLFLFNLVTSLLSQKVDYEFVYTGESGGARNVAGYEMKSDHANPMAENSDEEGNTPFYADKSVISTNPDLNGIMTENEDDTSPFFDDEDSRNEDGSLDEQY